MPVVRIISPTEVSPNPVPLRRDDQTIMWRLDPGLAWGTTTEAPVRFIPGGGSSPGGQPYNSWPTSATSPAPIDTGHAVDRRPYWASANNPMPSGQTDWYHYEVWVVPVDASGIAAGAAMRVQVQAEDGSWHDPDVVNEPKP
jgi:hypothetical protein